MRALLPVLLCLPLLHSAWASSDVSLHRPLRGKRKLALRADEDNTKSILYCEGALPPGGFPKGQRTNYTSLTSFCSQYAVCLFNISTSVPLGWRNGTNPTATAALAEHSCGSCTCLTAKEYNQVPQLDNLNRQLNITSCPNGPVPKGHSIEEYRTWGLNWNLSCFPDLMMPVFTIVDDKFDPGNARLCNVCPSGYGPDLQCQRQPIPLPGPCCYPRKPCVKTDGSAVGFPGNGSYHWVDGARIGDLPQLVKDSEDSIAASNHTSQMSTMPATNGTSTTNGTSINNGTSTYHFPILSEGSSQSTRRTK